MPLEVEVSAWAPVLVGIVQLWVEWPSPSSQASPERGRERGNIRHDHPEGAGLLVKGDVAGPGARTCPFTWLTGQSLWQSAYGSIVV